LSRRPNFLSWAQLSILKIAINYSMLKIYTCLLTSSILKIFFYQEIIHLRFQVQHYKLDVPNHPKLKNMLSLANLCQRLVETEKSIIYPLIDRLIRLILILSISTLTTEWPFSAMKIVKTRLRNQMNDDFLANYLIVYIEK